MFWLITRLRKEFPNWDRPTQIAFLMALLLFIVLLIVGLASPLELRTPALIGAGGSLLVMQLAVMWGNRGMVNVFTQAQRAYLDGDLEGARALLEGARTAGKADMRALTLLGNTYRQLGRLAESEAVLYEALDKAPDHQFPLYGFGRTLLSEGRYEDAAAALVRALDAGAPAIAWLDLAEAYYRLKRHDEARAALEKVPAQTEDYRALMAVYLRYQLGGGEPPTAALVEAGLPYWEASVARFRATPYSEALIEDMRTLRDIAHVQ
jgi:tetratricopeptide (TPR) repeat protein